MTSTIKQLVPDSARKLYRRWRTHQIQQQYAPLTLAQTFDQVYATNAWGGSDPVTPNSGEGSTGRYVIEYCELIKTLLSEYNVKTVADLGCGDFNTGKVIASMVDRYVGADISQWVIDTNTRIHSSDRVRFVRVDLTRDALPPADVAIVRQVLQHLTNAEVAAALRNIMGTYSLAMITEHIYVGPGATPNLDIAHGPGTRVPLKSGIQIDQAPFQLSARLVADIEYSPNEALRTWVVRTTARA